MTGVPDPPVATEGEVSLGRLADAAVDGLVGVAEDLTIVEASESFCRTVGRTRPAVVGTPFAAHFVEQEQAAKGVRLTFDLAQVWDYELTLLADGGRRVPVSLNAAFVPGVGRSRVAVISVRDSSDRRELERQLSARVRELLGRVTAAQDEERARIARDIHDDAIQLLAALSARLLRLRSRLDDPGPLQMVTDAEHSAEVVASRLRGLVFQLRPPELDLDRGLLAILREHVASTEPDSAVAGDIIGCPPDDLSPESRLVVYRIATEALANVRKHADASRVLVEVEERDGGCLVRIKDNGRGFDPASLETVPGHLGVTAMRERAEMAGGWWRCQSHPGKGTLVEFWVPR